MVEAMVAIAVMLALMAVAVPSFRDASNRSQLRATANDLVTSAHLARSEAIKRNAPVTMCASSDGEHCVTSGNWNQGWIIRGDTTLRRQTALPSRVRIAAGGIVSLTFQPMGGGATAATFTICNSASTAADARVVTIDATGRPSLRKLTNTTCS